MEIPCAKSCRNIEQAKLYKAAPSRRLALISLSVLLYAMVLPYVWQTMGEPRRRAMVEAEALERRQLQAEEELLEQDSAEVVVSWGDDEQNDHSFALDSDTEADLTQVPDDEILAAEEAKEKAALEKLRKRRAKLKKKKENKTEDEKDEEEEEEEEERPLPATYLPDAGAAAALFALVTGTILFNLLCRWFVWFYAMFYFEQTDKMEKGAYVYVLPYEYRGKPEIVPVFVDPTSGRFAFEFQRQKFELVKDVPVSQVKLMGVSKSGERVDHDDEDILIQRMSEEERKSFEQHTAKMIAERGVFQPVINSVDQPVKFYISCRGHKSNTEVDKNRLRYGMNSLQIEMKTMPTLVKEGLLSPLAMFQFFSTALWLMDEYWQYTLFNMFSIVMMEALTAFQRFRTMRTLKGLAPKPYELPVFRQGAWVSVKTTELIPGDLISLSSSAHSVGANNQSNAGKSGTDAVPCDCLILYGSAVVNEATLTGESVPQMKDALKATTHANLDDPLDMQGRDRVHVMFSGTTLISATPGEAEEEMEHLEKSKSFPKSPDGGCLCYVLRTGFSSSQGELMQMIEFSTEQVSADSKETGIALFVLFCFALISAGYVFKRGLEKGDRTTHELLLKCIIILTSVVPRQLPIQMAMAVNHALMTLSREGIFCTEPYRVPYAGKITHCLFDKTGTLTTDELVPVGVVNNDSKTKSFTNVKDLIVPVKKADKDATMVLAACHSLVAMPLNDKDNKKALPGQPELLGDPIELAAMNGVQWSFDPNSQRASPGNVQTMNAALSNLKKKITDEHAKMTGIQQAQNLTTAQKQAETKRIETAVQQLTEQHNKLEKSIQQVRDEAAKFPLQGIKILQRFHFSSKLQRMSVICRVQKKGSNEYDAAPLCLVKGSPEALMKLIKPDSIPEWYKNAYRMLAEAGMRVLALGFKVLSDKVDVNNIARDVAESDLSFAGFIAFECKTRADSAMVIQSLREADHRVAMITGDAPLTALHVAKITNICGDETRKDNPPLLLSLCKSGSGVEWVGAIGPEEECVRIPFEVNKIPELGAKHDLLTTEDALLEAVNLSTGALWTFVDHFQVFARMSPQGKAKIIRMIQQFQDNETNIETASFVPSSQKNFVLMCGDGGNDVGALKQADVGLALLSGYGNANTDETLAALDGESAKEGVDAETLLNEQAEKLKLRAKFAEKEKKAEFEKKKKEIMARQKDLVIEEVQRLESEGQTGLMVQFTAVKNVTQRLRADLAKEVEILNRKYNVNTKKKSKNADADPTELALEALDDPNALPIVRPGDASIAAPFTSRMPSVRSAIQLIRQGRCTLLSALMQQQIMMLESVISAYCLAALSLEGARSSERQMMASSWLIMIASLAFSYSTPIEKMHPVRPLRSLFHPAICLSIIGQAAIHLYCMVTAVDLAKSAMGEEKLREVVAFNKRVSRGLEKKLEEEGDALDSVAQMMMIWSTPFMPNLMNTVIFLVETSQIMAVMFVNYKGRPFMLGMLENSALFLSLFLSISGLIFFSWGISPEINDLIHLHPFPDDEFRFKVFGLVMLTLFGSFVWDRLVTALFAPRIFKAMLEQASQTTLKDLVPVFQSLFKVVLGFAVFGSGNPLIWIGAWWLYKKRQASIEQQELASLADNN